MIRALAKMGLMLVCAAILFNVYLFSKLGFWTLLNPWITSFMHTQGKVFELRHQWVPYEDISRHVKRAVIAAEDSNFSEHTGVDWDALERAYEKNTRRGKVVAGGSTITQQLAKNLFLTSDRSYLRKGQEFIITFMLEFWMDKQRIFEIYLNVVEWGQGVFGIEAAAQHYFRLPAAKLGPQQAARLAAMLPNPRYFDKNRNDRRLLWKTNLILRRMGAAELPK
ncbi:MAG: monofunctional biosynthetic peptidoglycan transglycosylase [Burkholderiales bacterium]|jgi:monofunctional biosynthetic peptidoglycan transglycosylase|nr:monofunctional biosynthetic peptidoglycan transglycosylase [Burkholderiales bacterium]MCA3155745.1 monofunctional biosynthetic peptidoglycan transglycosylase [Burkholderiales bacterium]MCA3156853.1 monofunctional biosynthetic peptidoglycan transglycosylase [Burkholderiales bacterium]MCA3167401.1 monofunctional biosynthetic peptidoglycan transglycosylase [Burkholderiales bacterium]